MRKNLHCSFRNSVCCSWLLVTLPMLLDTHVILLTLERNSGGYVVRKKNYSGTKTAQLSLEFHIHKIVHSVLFINILIHN
jgi:hypothetical protein